MRHDVPLDGKAPPSFGGKGRMVLILAACAFVAAADGFDTQVVGFTGPLLARDLRFPISALGWVFAAGQLGGVLGAVVFGALADRFGRVRMLALCCVIAALLTLATTYAGNLHLLLLVRFLTGLGLGGAVPCFLGLGIQAMPARARQTGTAILYAMFPAGGIVGGLASALVVVDHGWRGVFLMSAAFVGVAILPLLAVSEAPVEVSPKAGSPIGALFANGQGRITLWVWALFLCTTPSVVLLALWMPALLQMIGVPVARTSILVGLLNTGSLAMSLVIGWLIQRFTAVGVLAPVLVGGGMMWLAIAAFHGDFGLLVVAVILAGSLIGGATTGVVAIAATIFPEDIRATGLGTAFGFGRLGQVMLPPVIGGTLAWTASPVMALLACAVPSLLALIPLIALSRAQRSVPTG